MQIAQSQASDVDAILDFYEHAVRLQRLKGATQWPAFDRGFVESEVSKGLQWKIIVDGRPRCVWAVADSDPLIWGERDVDPAIYIHRIATDPEYQGSGFVLNIVDWAKAYAAVGGRRFVRMDTVGDNAGLIRHYTKCGFVFLGLSKLADTAGLPPHYHDATVSLFEIDLS